MQKEEQVFLDTKALEIRTLIMRMISKKGKGHYGGSLSLAEILSVLYYKVAKIDPENPEWDKRDRIVLSKGHAGPALYAVLANMGFFPMEWLSTLNAPHTKLPSHTDRTKTPGIDMTAGSLGQGLSVAVGMAEGALLNGFSQRVYAIIGDGESQEGQIWEALMYAGVKKLSNLTVILDRNRMQSDDCVKNIMDIEDIAAKFRAFRLNVIEVDGHNVDELYDAFMKAKEETSMPTAIIAHTIKGKGILKYQDTPASHAPEIHEEEAEEIIKQMNKEAAANGIEI